MKLSFSTGVYSSFPVWLPSYPLDVTIRRLAAIGYDAIEIMASSPHAYPPYVDQEERKRIREVLTEARIAVSSMLPAPGGGRGNNPASPNEYERRATVEQYKEVIELCADWGAPVIIYVAGWQIFGTEQARAWDWSVRGLREVAKAAEEVGVTVVVEPTPADSNLVESCDDALRMRAEAQAANVKVMFDTYHVIYRNEVPSDYVAAMGEHLAHVHFADHDRLPPGPGRIDWGQLLASLEAVGYGGYGAFEIGFDRRDVDPDAIAREAYTYLRTISDRGTER